MVCVPVFHLKDADEAQKLEKVLKQLCRVNCRFELEAVVVRDSAVVVFYHRKGASTLSPECYVTEAKRAIYCTNLLNAAQELDSDIYQNIIGNQSSPKP